MKAIAGADGSDWIRLIEPREVANLVAFVANPRFPAINGAVLRVDGGVTP